MNQASNFIEHGELRLYAATFMPDDAAALKGLCLMCHPLFEEKKSSHRFFVELARELGGKGIACMLPDLSACGDSGGDIRHFSVPRWLDDLSFFLSQLITGQSDAIPVVAVGIRFGACLAAQLAARHPGTIDSLALIDPVVNGKDYLDELSMQKSIREMMTFGESRVTDDFRLGDSKGKLTDLDGYIIPDDFLKSIEALEIANFAGNVHGMLILQNSPGNSLNKANSRLLNSFSDAGCHCESEIIRATPFWKANDLGESRAASQSVMNFIGKIIH